MNTGYGYTIGRRHATETDEVMRVCQDVADSYEDDKIAIIAVADGKAGKNLPAAAVAAARANIDAIFSFFRDPATWHIRERNQFKETALRMLENALENVAAGEEYEFEELRATVSAVAVRANGEYLAISIGDSAVIAFDADMKPKVLIPPYREGVKNRTVYTNDL
ncbi:MAG: protein phosphatase 2C domain-containing protein, partial [Oscillospiraceae bacterium]|nr:protein phosphatase 2C domain-containing protein [Oscillospiraceae bacterium]